MKRLFSLSSELATRLQNMPPEQQCALKNIACSYAVKTAGITDQRVLSILTVLNAGGTIDSSSKEYLQQLMNDWDEQYFDSTEKEPTDDQAAMDYFHKARAIASLLEATKEDGFDAATDSIYEAAMAAPDQDELINHLLHSKWKND